jgi:hypothetical protein
MRGTRKSRTPTSEHEQSVLVAHIRRFFAAPDRSTARSDIVREVQALLNVHNREWTSRTIRLWFNNNRKHYIEGTQTPPRLVLPPIPEPDASAYSPQSLQYGFPPLTAPAPAPFCWPAGVPMLPNPSPVIPASENRTDKQNEKEHPPPEPSRDLYKLPLRKRPPK